MYNRLKFKYEKKTLILFTTRKFNVLFNLWRNGIERRYSIYAIKTRFSHRLKAKRKGFVHRLPEMILETQSGRLQKR
jgi:hypothetical protein